MIEASRSVITTYKGPTEIITICAGAHSVRVARPKFPDRLLDEPAVLERNRLDDAMPYWAFVWPSAFLLAEAISRLDRPEHGRLLEIGCGLGIAGMFALKHGWKVVFSDEDLEALAFASRSAAINGHEASTYQTARINWKMPAPERFRLVIGSDILYEKHLAPTLACFLRSILDDGGAALVADPGRASASSFPDEVERVGLVCRREQLRVETSEFDLVSGWIYHIRWPSLHSTSPGIAT